MNLLGDRIWWALHLHETAASASEQDDEWERRLNLVSGTTGQERDWFWNNVLEMGDDLGQWPQVHIGLPGGHVVSVVYYGAPRFEVEYRYGTPGGESLLIAKEGGNCMLPGLRWAEVERVSSLVPHIEDETLLLIAPAADIPDCDATSVRLRISRALAHVGFRTEAREEFAADVVNGRRSEIEWTFDESYGWITSEWRCWRCPTRPKHGLTCYPREVFVALKEFTGYLGLNPEP